MPTPPTSASAIVLLALVLLDMGCSTREPVETITRDAYPDATAPAETVFAFFKRAIRADDAEAAYYCLGQNIRSQITFSQFLDGWTLFGESFALFADAEIASAQDVAEGRLLTIELFGLEEPFLWGPEAAGYRLVLPSPYNRRSLEDLLSEVKTRGASHVKPRPRPERRGG